MTLLIDLCIEWPESHYAVILHMYENSLDCCRFLSLKIKGSGTEGALSLDLDNNLASQGIYRYRLS